MPELGYEETSVKEAWRCPLCGEQFGNQTLAEEHLSLCKIGAEAKRKQYANRWFLWTNIPVCASGMTGRNGYGYGYGFEFYECKENSRPYKVKFIFEGLKPFTGSTGPACDKMIAQASQMAKDDLDIVAGVAFNRISDATLIHVQPKVSYVCKNCQNFITDSKPDMDDHVKYCNTENERIASGRVGKWLKSDRMVMRAEIAMGLQVSGIAWRFRHDFIPTRLVELSPVMTEIDSEEAHQLVEFIMDDASEAVLNEMEENINRNAQWALDLNGSFIVRVDSTNMDGAVRGIGWKLWKDLYSSNDIHHVDFTVEGSSKSLLPITWEKADELLKKSVLDCKNALLTRYFN